jgi:hypothetical protein
MRFCNAFVIFQVPNCNKNANSVYVWARQCECSKQKPHSPWCEWGRVVVAGRVGFGFNPSRDLYLSPPSRSAGRVGFEPTRPVTVYTLSRRVESATLTPTLALFCRIIAEPAGSRNRAGVV